MRLPSCPVRKVQPVGPFLRISLSPSLLIKPKLIRLPETKLRNLDTFFQSVIRFKKSSLYPFTMRRNNRDIEADILDVALQGCIKTWIVYRANLNFNLVKRYLAGLISRGFIAQEGKLYFTTSKGREYMQAIQLCQGFQ